MARNRARHSVTVLSGVRMSSDIDGVDMDLICDDQGDVQV
jgi:hypothetical protein